MKKIDAHLHVANVIAGYCRRGELRACGDGNAIWGNGDVFRLLPEGYGDSSFLAERALEIMDSNDVDKAVLMQGSMYGFQNQYHYELLNRYPERFCPSCTVDPFMTNHLETLNFLLKERNFRLVKFEISSGGGLMGCHEPFQLNSPRMMEIYRLIAKNHGVVALDVGDLTMPSHQPQNLMKIAKELPELNLVVCHLLAPMKGHEAELMESLGMLALDNVWFDLAALPKILNSPAYPYPDVHEILKVAKQIVGTKRMMWGTDAPFAATRDSYEYLTDYLGDGTTFSQEELADIYYNNANWVYFGDKRQEVTSLD